MRPVGPSTHHNWCPQGGTIHIPVIRGASDVRAVDLPLELPVPGRQPHDLASIRDIDELPPYIAEVVKAVACGAHTSREFAQVRGISISNASERFRVARRLGWIVPIDGRYLLRQGIRYIFDPSGRST